MGLYDTINQVAKPIPQGQMAGGGGGNSIQSAVGGMGQAQPMDKLPNAMGQGFAQQKPIPSGNQPMQMAGNMGMKPKPMMQGVASNWAQNRPGAGGSNSMIQAKLQMQKQKQAQEAAIGGSMGQPPRPQYGLQDVASRMEQERNPAPMQQSPMAQAAEQMRGYDGPDLGSQDPRELARTQNQNQGMSQLYGSTPLNSGQTTLQNAPFQGGGNPSFQDMMRGAEFSRPDVMSRGLGPSYGEQMDENGLEPRRGAR